jgi:hypothetical protein
LEKSEGKEHRKQGSPGKSPDREFDVFGDWNCRTAMGVLPGQNLQFELATLRRNGVSGERSGRRSGGRGGKTVQRAVVVGCVVE